MTNRHLTQETLTRLRHQQLGEGELTDATRHVRNCDECASRAAQESHAETEAIRRILADAAEAEHLDADGQLIPYVEGKLGAADREIVESHLDDCASCRVDVDDLRALRQPVVASTPRIKRWMRQAAVVALAVALFAAVRFFEEEPVVPPERSIAVDSRPAALRLPSKELPPARYAVDEWNGLVARARADGKLPFPPLDDLRLPPDALRGPTTSPNDIVSPAGVVIDETRPELTWRERDGATYVVTINSGDEEVARSETLRSARWKPDRPLRRGRTYVWQVEIARGTETELIPAPPAMPAIFRIASERDHRDIERARKQYPDDHFLHAVLYARAGLRAEAEAAMKAANP